MQLAEWIVQQLGLLECKYIFMVPGGELDPLVAVIGAQTSVKPIVACHEQGAGFMADGYSRVSRHFSICMGIGAPGAANMLSALLTATSDSSALFCLTGGSSTDITGKGGFQDSSIEGTNDALLLKSATRYSEACHIADQVPRKWQAALQAMYGNSPGAVHLTLPMDLQIKEITPPNIHYESLCQKRHLLDTKALDHVIKHNLSQTKTALLVGRGAVVSGAQHELQTFVEQFHLPFALTFAAKGLLPETHPLCLGMFGYAGHKRAIEALLGNQIETLIILGSSLNARDTLCWSKELLSNKTLIQIDMDATALNRNYPVTIAIQSDCSSALNYFNRQDLSAFKNSIKDRKEWAKQILHTPLFYDTDRMQSQVTPLEPGHLIATVNQLMPDNTICFIDSGAHRAFAGHYWVTRPGGKIISATNIGPMGWAIAASIGGKLAAPENPVIAITGDGCLRMNGMEISTAARYQIPVIFLISNNHALGNVYLREKNVNQGAINMTELPDIDWVSFAKTLGADGVTVRNSNDISDAVNQALASKKPFIINAITTRDSPTPIKPYQEMVKEFLDS